MTPLLQDKKLQTLVAQIPVFANAENIATLPGGLTNLNYRVDTPTGTYVMRVGDPGAALLGINRLNERMNTAMAHDAGVGAALIDSLSEENVLVIKWIDAKTLHEADIKMQPAFLPRIADALRRLHSGPSFQGEFYFPDVRKKYLQTVLDNNYFLPQQYMELEPLVRRLETVIDFNRETFVSCNNDLLAENFMDDGKKIWIIDYEYAGRNEASFEIGNLASEIALNDEQLTILCDAYWQQHLPGKIARAMAWSMIARFGWTLWASIQEAISPIDFDFRSWGMRKWDSVVPELQGDRYKNVLNKLET